MRFVFALTICLSFFMSLSAVAAPPYKRNFDASRDVYIVSYADHRGQERRFQVHIPESLPKTGKVPALLVLHGGKGEADRIREQTNMSAYAQRYQYIAVYPETGDGSPWESGRAQYPDVRNDLQYFDIINDILINDLDVDPLRVYVTGISSGGGMALRLACDRTKNYAGYVFIASNFPKEYIGQCKPSGAPLIVAMSGTADKLMVFDGGQSDVGYLRRQKGSGVTSAPETWAFWARNNGCSSRPREVNLPDKHDDDTSVTAVIYQNCRAPVTAFRINNGGHNWPGGKSYSGFVLGRLVGNTTQEIDASDIISRLVATGRVDIR